MQRVNRRILILFVTILFCYSCADHDLADFGDSCADYSYSEDVDPIINTKCAISGCHNGSLGADKDWSNFETFQAKALTGIVKQRVVAHEMPPPGSPGGPLSEDQISIISCWIDNGALDN